MDDTMTYKNIMVAYNGGEASNRALAFAITLAKMNNAHLTGILAHGVSRVSRNVPNWFPKEMRDAIFSAVAQKTTGIRQRFHDEAKEQLPADCLHWLEVGGDPDQTIIDYARMYDLTILGAYENLAETDELELHPSRIIYASGKPAVLVNKQATLNSVPGHVVIAWDGGRTVTGTLSDSLPLLKLARKITIVSVESDRLHSPLEGIDATTVLSRHGLVAEHVKIEKSQTSISKALLTYCTKSDADMLVIGAYERHGPAHLLDGVTAKVMTRSDIPIFMSC